MSRDLQSTPKNYVSTKEAAEDLGYTVQHTRLLIRQGYLEAIKFGRDWLIVRESVAEYKARRENTSDDLTSNL
ncbi:MAG: DNA-binding protein [Bacteroidetes bacterium]|nr:MAG: DNA-binding protein [Bacteroidota bacterium]